MLLDTYNELFLWIGNGANDAEKKAAMQMASEYIKNSPDGRGPDTPVIIVKQGFEPRLFTANFIAWDPEKAKVRRRRAGRRSPALHRG